MKTIFLTTCFIFIQIQASFSINVKGLYEDTEKKLLEFTKQIDEKVTTAKLSLTISQFLLDDEERARLNNAKTKIDETASKYINNYKDWIEKAKKLNVYPSNCTKDWFQIEFMIPRGAYPKITDSFSLDSAPLFREWVYLFQNLSQHIPDIAKDLKKDFYNCDKNDEICIKNISKAIEENFGLFYQIQEIVVEIENIFGLILDVLDTCIDGGILGLETKEKELTDKGIECIKELLKL